MGFDIPACDTDDVDADERESEERAVLYLVGERVSEETKKRERGRAEMEEEFSGGAAPAT